MWIETTKPQFTANSAIILDAEFLSEVQNTTGDTLTQKKSNKGKIEGTLSSKCNHSTPSPQREDLFRKLQIKTFIQSLLTY